MIDPVSGQSGATPVTPGGSPSGESGSQSPDPAKRQPPVLAVEHDHVWVQERALQPACTFPGRTSGSYCAICSQVEVFSEEIPALGGRHEYEEGVCRICGAQEPSQGLELVLKSDGSGSYYAVAGLGSCRDETIVIPESADGLPVREISENAFLSCPFVGAIVLHDGIVRIGRNALTTQEGGRIDVYVHDLAAYCAIEFGRQEIERKLFVGGEELQEAVLPLSVTEILPLAFEGVVNPLTVSMPAHVTKIGSGAFENCTWLTGLDCSWTVTQIGSGAFAGCTNLQSVVLPYSLETLEANVFKDCRALTTLRLSEKIVRIGASAFEDCSLLQQIFLPASLRYVDSTAFSGCTSLSVLEAETAEDFCRISYGDGEDGQTPLMLTHSLLVNGEKVTRIVLPNDLTSVGNQTFRGFTDLKEVVFGENLTTIGAGAFAQTGIQSVDLRGVSSIGNRAFQDCKSLTSVRFSENAQSFGGRCFENCTSLFFTELSGQLTFGGYAFSGCSALRELTVFYSSKMYLGLGMFRGCTGLTRVRIESDYHGRLTLDNRFFEGCTSLCEAEIPGVSELYDKCFASTALQTLLLGENVRIYDGAFDYCTALRYVFLPFAETNYVSRKHAECSALFCFAGSWEMVNGVPVLLSGGDFEYEREWNGFVVTGLGSYVGRDLILPGTHEGIPVTGVNLDLNAYFETLYVPASVVAVSIRGGFERIEAEAGNPVFTVTGNCLIRKSDKTMVLGCRESVIPLDGSVTVIGPNAFSGGLMPEKIFLNDAVKRICSGALRGTGLQDLYLGYDLTQAHSVFDFGVIDLPSDFETEPVRIHDKLTIEYQNGVPVVKNDLKFYIFENKAYLRASISPEITDLYVPETYEGYPVVGIWGHIQSKTLRTVVLPETFRELEKQAFSGCSALVRVEMPGVRVIGISAFQVCTSLQEVIFGEELERIESGAFRGCTSLQTLALPASVREIAPDAFTRCTALQTNRWDFGFYVGTASNPYFYLLRSEKNVLELHKDVVVIGEGALEGTSISILPETVRAIGENAFQNATIESIVLPEGIEVLNDGVFRKCMNLKEISLPASLLEIGTGTFEGCTSLKTVRFAPGCALTILHPRAFRNCSALETIELPEKVHSIEELSFDGCENLTVVSAPSGAREYGDIFGSSKAQLHRYETK